MSPQRDVTRVGQLILVRLLPDAEKGTTLTEIRKALEPWLQDRWSGGALNELLERTLGDLVSAGLIDRTRKGKTDRSQLTAEGRRQALDVLGLDHLPPRATWATIKSIYLPARALGLPAPVGKAAERFKDAKGYRGRPAGQALRFVGG